MKDTLTSFSNSLIQHGKASDRIYLMKLHSKDGAAFLQDLEDFALENGYGKTIAKVPCSKEPLFQELGFHREAQVPSFYKNGEDGCFMGKFHTSSRKEDPYFSLEEEILSWALDKQKSKTATLTPLDESLELRPCTQEDAKAMASLYHRVFASYPFPIHDPDYIRKTMEENVHYYGIFNSHVPVALSSIEADFAEKNAELTDFATDPNYRGQALASRLIGRMESEMGKKGFQTAYTIARASSKGINALFARRGYRYGGRLINNTQIAGRLESMNIWHKKVRPSF